MNKSYNRINYNGRVISTRVSVIQRHIGERTADFAFEKLRNQNDIDLARVSAGEFYKTYMAGLDRAIEIGNEYTIFIDGDVIPFSNLNEQFTKLQNRNSKIYGFSSYVFDKFWLQPRSGGMHFYRTSSLINIRRKIFELEKRNAIQWDQINRPETFGKKLMENEGYIWGQTGQIIGFHDFGQSNFDIFRTCLFYGKKWSAHCGGKLDLWEKFGEIDPDFKIAILGFSEGLQTMYSKKLEIKDVNLLWEEKFATKYQEKSPKISNSEFVEILNDFKSLQINDNLHKDVFNHKQTEKEFGNIKYKISQFGYFRGSLWSLRSYLNKLYKEKVNI